MDQPAQSLYQLNEGRVYWDPYKHLRTNGMHPHYSWPGHEAVTKQELPPNPIRHVKRPLEQFARFNVKHYPGSKLTSRGRIDLVLYHPRYNGFRPRSLRDLDEPLDESWMFYPPEGEEWIKKPRSEENEEKGQEHPSNPPENTRAPSNHVEPRMMRPYLSPPRPTEQHQPPNPGTEKWGSYRGNTASSYKEHQQQSKESETKTDPRLILQGNAPSQTNNDAKAKGVDSVETPDVQPSTSRAVASKYVIPKVPRRSLQSSKLNELVAKVSPPARPILPRPPSLPRKSPSKNVKGTKSTRRRR